MKTCRKSLNSTFLFGMRAVALVAALCVFTLATGANANMLIDGSFETEPAEPFVLESFTSNLSAAATGTVVLDFDDLPPANIGSLPSDYAGIEWDSEWYWKSESRDPGYSEPHSGDNYLFNGWGRNNIGFSLPNPENRLVGAWFAKPIVTTPDRVRFNGYDAFHVLVQQSAWLTLSSTPQYLPANFDPVARIEVQHSSSRDAWYTMDDLTYEAGDDCLPPAAPNNPDPCDGAIDVPMDTNLAWDPGVSPPPPPGDIVINELYMAGGDWLELFNSSVLSVELTDWQVIAIDNNGSQVATLTIPDFVLEPGAYVVLHETAGTNTSTDLYFNTHVGWHNTRPGSCTLVDAGGVGVDFVRWSNSSGTIPSTDLPPAGTNWTGNDPWAPSNQTINTLGRDGVSTDTDDGSDWENTCGVDADGKTPGAANIGGAAVAALSEELHFDIDSVDDPPLPSSTTVPSGFLIRDGILVEEQSQEEFSTVVVESPAPSSLPAGATFINFDDVSAPCLFMDTIRLTDEYAALGVVFEGPGGNNGGAIVNECGKFGVSGHSSPNFLAFNASATLSDGGIPCDPETMHFSPAVSQVQVLAGSRTSAGEMLTMEAYNDINVLVDSATITLSLNMTPFSVSGIGITTVVLSTSARVFVLDDLTFSPENGPECPTTWDVYLGTDPCELELLADCNDICEPNCDPTPEPNEKLDDCVTFYWQVVAESSCGETEGPVWSFTTECFNKPPVANAGPDQNDVECACNTEVGTEATLDGTDSNDPDGDPLTYTWTGPFVESPADGCTPTVTLVDGCPGDYIITLVVNDGEVNSSPDDVTITVVDTTPPVITLNGSATVVSECGVDSYTEEGATATDLCDPDVAVVIGGDTVDPLTCGTYVVTYDATDALGNPAEQVTRTVIVQDTTPPTINSVSASPSVLWAPNHRMKKVTVTVDSEDICDPVPVCSIVDITSNEPINGPGDGNTAPDWKITGDLTVNLRTERAGVGTGRVYTIHVECTDASDNTTTATVEVTVPHDRGKGIKKNKVKRPKKVK